MESVTDKLNVLTNVLDVPTRPSQDEKWGQLPPPPHLGYANGSDDDAVSLLRK